MIFTGTRNLLYLPQKQKVSFEIKDILVNSLTAQYDFSFGLVTGNSYYHDTDIRASGYILSLISGDILTLNKGRRIGTYNSGEAFGFSGWIDTVSLGQLLEVDGILDLDTTYSGTNYYAARLQILSNVSSGSLSCNIKLDGEPIRYSMPIPNFSVNTLTTGLLATENNLFIYGSEEFFYNSHEQLLTPIAPIITFVDSYSPSGIDIVFNDGDNSYTSNKIDSIIKLAALEGVIPINQQVSRSMVTGELWSATGYNSGLSFGSLFNGTWSGSGFFYQDLPSSLVLNYRVSHASYLGDEIDKTIYWSLTSMNTPVTSYVTGFVLSHSGEYLYPPTLKFTGYYSVTGITQSFESLLFSSGCTGRLNVTFSGINGFGNGASGYFNTHVVTLQDIYTPGTNLYYFVDSYSILQGGTGYTQPPRAIINTGLWGSTCYDVPRVYGYDAAWFTPSLASGSLYPLADYLTGIPLYVTGLVSGRLATGYYITGIEIWNIGSGYTTGYFPKVSFIRDSLDTLTGNVTGNATGIFRLKSTTVNVANLASVDIQSGTYDWVTGTYLLGTTYNLGRLDSFSLRIAVTGADNTSPWTGRITIKENAGAATYLTDDFTFAHTFDTDYNALKKNYSVTTGLYYPPNSELSFLVTEDELDTLYSDAAYTNNSLGIDLGDFDF
jgi:hypothetical protein